MDSADIIEMRKSMNELNSKLDVVLHEIDQRQRHKRTGVINEVVSGLPSLILFALIIAGLVYFYKNVVKNRL